MPVIAMTREMGSLGKDVALGLAEQLDLKLVQHEVIEHVADKMHLRRSTVNRFLEGKAGLLERWNIDEKRASLYTAEEIYELASAGNVLIRGWGATYLLRSIAHVACVRVCAPLQQRVQVLQERIGIEDTAAARKEIEKNDEAHGRTMRNLFHVDWQDPLLYDIVLNSGHVSVNACIALIKKMIEQPSFQETPESRAELDHLQLEARVRSALKSDEVIGNQDYLFEIEVERGGTVVLNGLVESDAFVERAKRVLAAIPGVIELDNRLLVSSHLRYGP